MVIFFKAINDCSMLHFMCKESLSKDVVQHVDMFHSQTPQSTKAMIRKDMGNTSGMVRLLICTTAACMGVNYVGVDNVINFGPPQKMDTLLQQQGRAGRTGQQAHNLLIYDNRQLRYIC